MSDCVLITGANGFVGGAVAAHLTRDAQFAVRAATRRVDWRPPAGAEAAVVGDLAPSSDWSRALAGVQCVVHAAARVHVMEDRAQNPLAEYRRVNVEGTLALARQAGRAGVRRFIFVSSIKVNGESTAPAKPFRASDLALPVDAYGISKLEAEAALAAVCAETGMELVIVRPPLVYGPGVGANFQRLMHWVRKGVPLPFAAIDNRRSLVGIDNLADLIGACIRHPAAAGQVLLASDDDDVSTPELIRKLAAVMNVRARLIAVPLGVLRLAAGFTGSSAALSRLCDSLQVDISATRNLLAWTPPVSLDKGLARAAAGFLNETYA
jgi:nucleoside-diphosphate-sugar epimerase